MVGDHKHQVVDTYREITAGYQACAIDLTDDWLLTAKTCWGHGIIHYRAAFARTYVGYDIAGAIHDKQASLEIDYNRFNRLVALIVSCRHIN